MPNSLKSKLKKLVYQGHLTEKDLSRLYTDNDVVAELEKIKAEFFDECPNTNARSICISIVNKHIYELKERTNDRQ